MPAFFLETPEVLPLPSLQAYTSISVLLLSFSVWFAFQATNDPDWKFNTTLSSITSSSSLQTISSDSSKLASSAVEAEILNRTVENAFDSNIFVISESLAEIVSSANDSSPINVGYVLSSPVTKRCFEIIFYMLHEPLCLWTVINMAFCVLILVGKMIQKLVFGELRVSEQQHMKDRFYNFIFYKFIFIFGILNVSSMDEVVLWVSWFSMLGFLILFAQLCRDRFEYISFSPVTPKWTHLKLGILLSAILASSFSLFIVCIFVGIHVGMNTFAFMAAECLMIAVGTLYTSIRYAIHLWDLSHQGVWENRASYAYYTELFFELASLFIDLIHHIHMLIWANILLSIASFIILTQLKSIFSEINKRIRKHKNYLQVSI